MRKNSEDVLNGEFLATLQDQLYALSRWRQMFLIEAMPAEVIEKLPELSEKLLSYATDAAQIGLRYGGRPDEYADELYQTCMKIINTATELRNDIARVRLA